MINIGIVGLGYWGPNLVRNGVENTRIGKVFVCDENSDRVNLILAKYHDVSPCENYEEMLQNAEVHAVAIATPVSAHYPLAKAALNAGKHIIVEKPFTASVDEAEELVALAKANGLKILVDHTFVYTSAIRKLKQLIDDDVIGELYYYDSVRVNLGLFQHDVNVIWDLAPHDFSIMDYLIGEKPISLSATGAAHIDSNGLENIAYVTLRFASGMIAHFHVNWLSPVKLRQTLIGGSKKMIIYDDIETAEKIRICDKGVNVDKKEDVYKQLIQYRSGDVHIPHLENVEALNVMMSHFVDCVENDKQPESDGEAGLRVVRLLAASQESIDQNGAVIAI